jgi:hypothetical protein
MLKNLATAGSGALAGRTLAFSQETSITIAGRPVEIAVTPKSSFAMRRVNPNAAARPRQRHSPRSNDTVERFRSRSPQFSVGFFFSPLFPYSSPLAKDKINSPSVFNRHYPQAVP